MTRFLSDSLQAPEPFFRLHLRQLERLHGNPTADIHLTSSVQQAVTNKVELLGLDPRDTTPQELYQSLSAQLLIQDAQLVRRLQTVAATHVSAEADIVAGMAQVLTRLPLQKNCFAIKATAFKRLIKLQPPKKAMKALGYRSLDSMLKRETMGAILAAAVMTETPQWQSGLHERYKKLTPRDFENRMIAIVHPTAKKWHDLALSQVAREKHNLLAFPEVGSIVLLPLPQQLPTGATTASLALALHALNEVRASSTFLKLCQVRPDFGNIVQTVATAEPQLQAHLLDKQVPWQLVQRYYARLQDNFRAELFEPHIKLEDLAWHSVEQVMSRIEPAFSFWRGSAHLGVLHAHHAVSLNLVDVALNACNKLPYEQRISDYFQKSLWNELLLKYLKPSTVEQTVLAELQPQLAYASASSN